MESILFYFFNKISSFSFIKCLLFKIGGTKNNDVIDLTIWICEMTREFDMASLIFCRVVVVVAKSRLS